MGGENEEGDGAVTQKRVLEAVDAPFDGKATVPAQIREDREKTLQILFGGDTTSTNVSTVSPQVSPLHLLFDDPAASKWRKKPDALGTAVLGHISQVEPDASGKRSALIAMIFDGKQVRAALSDSSKGNDETNAAFDKLNTTDTLPVVIDSDGLLYWETHAGQL